MNPYAQKLNRRLTSLTSATSSETIQTLTNWLCFNRRHAPTFATTFLDAIRAAHDDPRRQLLYLTVVHQCLTHNCPAFREKYPDWREVKWNRTSGFRNLLGEVVAVEGVRCIKAGRGDLEKLREMVEEWEDCDVFDDISIFMEARAVLEKEDLMVIEEKGEEVLRNGAAETKANVVDVVMQDVAETRKNGKGDDDNSTEVKNTIDDDESVIHEVSTPTKDESLDEDDIVDVLNDDDDDDDDVKEESNIPAVASNDKQQQEQQQPTAEAKDNTNDTKQSNTKTPTPISDEPFDFESQGIAAGPVSSQDLAPSCKSIATLQITREIQSDVTHRLDSLLETIPPQICDAARACLKDQTPFPENLTKTLADLSPELLDIDIAEAYREIKQYKEVVAKQRRAREICVNLLIKSRCQFASEEAAEVFYDLKEKLDILKQKKLMVADAMELEGWDVEKEVDDDEGAGEQGDVGTLEWFTPKRQRTR